MQRLFSIFPAHAAGIGLLLLRFSVAVTLARVGPRDTDHWSFTLAASFIWPAALLLGLGLFTPLIAAAVALLLGTQAIGPRQIDVPLLTACANAAALVVLGPGAYSIDALRFGRRVVASSPPRR